MTLRKGKTFNLIFRLASIFIAVFFAAIVLIIAGENPFVAFGHIFLGAVSSDNRIANVLVAWVPLVITTSGLAITFTVGLWNIGIEGQITLGAIFTTWALRSLLSSSLQPMIIISIGILAGILGGMLWALLAGILKFFGGVNEIFAGLGLNFIATALTIWLIFGPWKRPGVGSMSGTVPFEVYLSLPTFPGLRLGFWPLFLAILSVVIVYIILFKTYTGYAIKAVGKNQKAAVLLGISPVRYMLLAFLICGFFAGLTGAIQVVGVYHRLIPSISSGYGFLGLLVSMLVNFHPVYAAPVAMLFAALNIGGIQLPIEMKIDSTLSGVLQSALVLSFLLLEGVRKKYFPNSEVNSDE